MQPTTSAAAEKQRRDRPERVERGAACCVRARRFHLLSLKLVNFLATAFKETWFTGTGCRYIEFSDDC